MDVYLKILTFLSKHDNGEFIEITHLIEDFKLLYNKTLELKKKGLIVIKSAGVFVLASGGQSTVIGDKENLKKIFAKITLSGHEYLKDMKKNNINNYGQIHIGDNHGNQSFGSSNSPQKNNKTPDEKRINKTKSFIVKVWLLISENKLISSFIILLLTLLLYKIGLKKE